MRNKKAKELKRIAQQRTVGKPKATTRKVYRKMKREYRDLRESVGEYRPMPKATTSS